MHLPNTTNKNKNIYPHKEILFHFRAIYPISDTVCNNFGDNCLNMTVSTISTYTPKQHWNIDNGDYSIDYAMSIWI